MSLPLTRRIARAALLIAAGTVPVVGAAGSASAVELQQANPLGGLTAPDAGALNGVVDGAAQKTSELADSTGNDTVKETVPAATETVSQVGKAATPAAQKAAGEVASSASTTLGRATGSTGGSLGGLPTGQLGSTLPADQLPLKGLPLG
ncbi:ATP-binding protein [Streptomyces sp. NPDC005963]|uniref:ATP-binding protein n=1 Tax=Streptomyces sp. NPDC005963 TaxID=3156721 RepID=UPI0033C41773